MKVIIKSYISLSAVLGLLAASSIADARPNAAEVGLFRVLVASHSKTSGGESPALSPDGKTLAFAGHTGGLWIQSGVSLERDRMPDPWRLKIADEESGRPDDLSWSPDGKSLCFVYDDDLYVAENFDMEAKTADIKLLAAGKSDDAAGSSKIQLPRWSPDGSKIAFILRHDDGHGRVCFTYRGAVVSLPYDDASGCIPWIQPWSPDGESLTYSAETSSEDEDGETSTDVYVISLWGTEKRRITSDGGSKAPSWSPSSDQVAYMSTATTQFRPEEEKTYTVGFPIIALSDSDGKNYIELSKPVLDEMKVTQLTDILLQVLKAAYSDDLGEDFVSVIEEIERKPIPGWKKMEMFGDALGQALANRADDDDSIAVEKREIVEESINQALDERSNLLRSVGTIVPVIYNTIWSPDGTQIAFIRMGETSNLHIITLDTGEEKEIFYSDGEIDSVSWIGDKMLIQSRRAVSRSDSETYTMDYPEIWLLQLGREPLWKWSLD